MDDKLNIGLQFFADPIEPLAPSWPHKPPPSTIMNLWSNDGSTFLWEVDLFGYAQYYYDSPSYPRGIYDSNNDLKYDLTEYAGVATTPYATEPELTDGDAFDATAYYVVPSSGGGGNTLDVTYNSAKIIDSLEVTPPVAVTYNGSTIATLNAGDTKTLQCNGKVMASDVIIGGKTLQCNGKLMASDVVIEVGGALSETWLMEDYILPRDDADLHFDVSFTSNGNQYTEFAVKYSMNGNMVAVFFDNFATPVYVVNPYVSQKWVNQAYRTITLDSPATGDFLTWLEANAVKQ